MIVAGGRRGSGKNCTRCRCAGFLALKKSPGGYVGGNPSRARRVSSTPSEVRLTGFNPLRDQLTHRRAMSGGQMIGDAGRTAGRGGKQRLARSDRL